MRPTFFDTSILLGGLIDFGDASQAPMQILDRIAEGDIEEPATAWHCCLEFYSVATRLPEEYRLRAPTAAEFVHEEIIDRLGIHVLDTAKQRTLFTQAASQLIAGGRIYDFHIGMIALENQASVIVTENKKHFLNFEKQGLAVRSASEYLLEASP